MVRRIFLYCSGFRSAAEASPGDKMGRKLRRVRRIFCRLYNDVLHIRERRKDGHGGHPVERAHGKAVILPLADSKLFDKVIEGIEGMTGIKFFVIFSVAAFHFAVMPRSKGTNLLVPDAKTSQRVLKER